MREIDLYLMHYGVPGMKWGQRRERRDLNKLAKRANDYYSALNKYNQDVDSGAQPSQKRQTNILKKRDKVASNVNKLVARYGDARVEPTFKADGYTIESVSVAIGKLDSSGRVTEVSSLSFQPGDKKKNK